MIDQLTRLKANMHLRAAIVGARKARGLNVAQAASLAGLTESELLTIEENPILVSMSVLYRLMVHLNGLQTLLNATNDVTVILLKRDDIKEKHKTPTVIAQPQHPDTYL